MSLTERKPNPPSDPDERGRVFAAVSRAVSEGGGVRFAYVHGSFVEGRPFRDVDVGLWLDGAIGEEEGERLAARLERALVRATGLAADVRPLNRASVGFQYAATAGILAYEDDEEFRIEKLRQIRDRHFDFQPVLRRHLSEMVS